jgi:hypothetical protein
LPLASADAWWDIVYSAGYRGLLLAMPDEQRRAFKKQHLAEVQGLIDGGASHLDVRVIVAVSDKHDARS